MVQSLKIDKDVPIGGKPAMHPPQRPEDSKAAADARAAEILEHLDETPDTGDKFHIPEELKQDGWDYNWKTYTVLNQPLSPMNQPHLLHINQMRRTGWEYVKPDEMPGMVAMEDPGGMILREGQVLMKRPAVISKRFAAKDLANARAQVDIREQQLNQPPPKFGAQFDRDNKGSPLVKVRRTVEIPT